MWMVVYVSQDGTAVKKLVEILRENHILSRVRRIGNNGERQGFEVLVPQTELNSAQDIIIDSELF